MQFSDRNTKVSDTMTFRRRSTCFCKARAECVKTCNIVIVRAAKKIHCLQIIRADSIATSTRGSYKASLRRRCRSLDSTRSSRCPGWCQWSWPRVECRECWAHMSCQKDGSCTSHRSVTRCSWPSIGHDDPPGKCLSPCLSSCVLDGSPIPSL